MLEGKTCIAATGASNKECHTKKSDLTSPSLQLGSAEIAEELGQRTWSELSIHTQSTLVNGSFSVSVYTENKTDLSEHTFLSSLFPITDDKLTKIKSSNISVYIQSIITNDYRFIL